MQTSYRITLENYIQAQRLHTKQPAWLLVVIFAGMGVLIAGAATGLANGQFGLFPILTTLLLPIFYLLARYIIAPRQYKQAYEQQADLQTPITLEITTPELIVSNPQGLRRYAWKEFIKIKEDPDLLLLYTANIIFIPLPKNQIEAAFLNEIKQYLEA